MNAKDNKWLLAFQIITSVLLIAYPLNLVVSSYRWDLPCIRSKGTNCYRPVSRNTTYR